MFVEGKRAVLQADGSVTIEEFVVPEPGPDQVLVRVKVTQVSAGTEVNTIRQRRGAPPGNFPNAGLGYTAIGSIAHQYCGVNAKFSATLSSDTSSMITKPWRI